MATARWAAKFESYIQQCPQAEVLFERFARQVLNVGHKHYGANDIVGRMRWESAIGAIPGEQFKINQNYATYFANDLMQRCPEFAGFFRQRRTRR